MKSTVYTTSSIGFSQSPVVSEEPTTSTSYSVDTVVYTSTLPASEAHLQSFAGSRFQVVVADRLSEKVSKIQRLNRQWTKR